MYGSLGHFHWNDNQLGKQMWYNRKHYNATNNFLMEIRFDAMHLAIETHKKNNSIKLKFGRAHTLILAQYFEIFQISSSGKIYNKNIME